MAGIMLTFVIPAAPGKNRLYRNVSASERARAHALGLKLRGRRRTQDYNVWRYAAGWAMRMDGSHARTWEPLTGPVTVEIITGNPRQDSDASIPAIFDLFTEMRVWLDDRQVASHTVRRGPNTRETVVIVRPVEAEARAA